MKEASGNAEQRSRARPAAGSAPCSPPSRTLRARGGLRPSLTAAARGACRTSGRGKETAPSRTKKQGTLDTPAGIREHVITAIISKRGYWFESSNLRYSVVLLS